MSKVVQHNTHKPHPEEHGSISSYVIGFALSIAFTLIPYYLVVNESFKGNDLLVIIVGFALIQMVIQVTFFLHLGRGPKPNWNLFFFISTVGIIVFIMAGSIVIMNQLHYNMSPEEKVKKLVNDENIYQVGGEETGACHDLNDNHRVIIKDSQVYPSVTIANKCDTLTFTNEDDESREIAFGEHPDHGVYAGESELKVIKKGRSTTITLSETGTFHFHDHLHEEIAGEFTVNEY